MTELDKVLGTIQQAIEIEKFGYSFYTNMRGFVKDKDGHKLITNFANLEIDHIKWLEDEYKKQFDKIESLDETPTIDVSITGKEDIFLRDKLPEIFKDFDSTKAVKFAIDIEKRSVDFYKNQAEITSDSDLKDLFNRLADFEKEHITILSQTLKSLETKDDWGLASLHIHW